MKYVRLKTRVDSGKEMKPGRAPVYIKTADLVYFVKRVLDLKYPERPSLCQIVNPREFASSLESGNAAGWNSLFF